MAGDFFIQAYEWWSGPGSCLAFSKTPNGGPGAKSQKKNSILKISKVLFYSSKSQDFYGIVVGNPWIWKRKFNHSVLIASLKSLVLTQIGLRLSQEP